MSEELKKCAHCASRNITTGHCFREHWVLCEDCGMTTGLQGNKELARKVWNTRATPWIKVKDRSPEIGKSYIFKTNWAHYVGLYTAGDDIHPDHFVTTDSMNKKYITTVTHYMPIPEIKEGE